VSKHVGKYNLYSPEDNSANKERQSKEDEQFQRAYRYIYIFISKLKLLRGQSKPSLASHDIT